MNATVQYLQPSDEGKIPIASQFDTSPELEYFLIFFTNEELIDQMCFLNFLNA
jgi:hypothetical protein